MGQLVSNLKQAQCTFENISGLESLDKNPEKRKEIFERNRERIRKYRSNLDEHLETSRSLWFSELYGNTPEERFILRENEKLSKLGIKTDPNKQNNFGLDLKNPEIKQMTIFEIEYCLFFSVNKYTLKTIKYTKGFKRLLEARDSKIEEYLDFGILDSTVKRVQNL